MCCPCALVKRGLGGFHCQEVHDMILVSELWVRSFKFIIWYHIVATGHLPSQGTQQPSFVMGC